MNAQFEQQLKNAKQASYQLSTTTTEQRNAALEAMIKHLQANKQEVLEANQKDVAKMDPDDPMVDRLLLTDERIDGICSEIETVRNLEDPLNIEFDQHDGPSGIHLKKISVPLGTIGIVYESRPNVTVDISSICIKSGNTVMLRGSSSAYESNQVLTRLIQAALKEVGLDENGVQLMETDRALVKEMLTANEYIDLVIPRGGKNLINMVRQEASVPTIETGASVVHTYIDAEVDIKKAVDVIFNEKTRRVSVCNALDTLLVHSAVAEEVLTQLSEKYKTFQPLVEIKADERAHQILEGSYEKLSTVSEGDYATEFLDYIMNAKVVDSIDEAVEHIRQYSLRHSESIMTNNEKHAQQFQQQVDAACVYVNTSTCFSDGAQFGLGAEIGISTQKMHARGPMALKELTSYKWLIDSNYLTRA